MTLRKLPFLVFLQLLPFVLTQSTQVIQVGYQGLQFAPNTLYAAAGDKIEFQFIQPQHSVAEGSYTDPCKPSGSGNSSFYSGILDVGKSFTITVANSDPIWFYCSVPSHCQAGMVGVINPPSTDRSLNGYRSAAGNAANSVSPASVNGGVLSDTGSASSSSAAAPSSTSSAPATSSSAASVGSSAFTSSLVGVIGGVFAALMV